MEVSEINNLEKYKKELRSTMKQVMVGGASVFKSKEEKGAIMQGLSLMSNSVHY